MFCIVIKSYKFFLIIYFFLFWFFIFFGLNWIIISTGHLILILHHHTLIKIGNHHALSKMTVRGVTAIQKKIFRLIHNFDLSILNYEILNIKLGPLDSFFLLKSIIVVLSNQLWLKRTMLFNHVFFEFFSSKFDVFFSFLVEFYTLLIQSFTGVTTIIWLLKVSKSMLLLTFASFYLLVWIFSWESLPRQRSFIQLLPIRQPHFFIISVFNFLSNFLWEYILLIESLMNWLSSSSILCKNTRNFIDFWFTFNFRMIKRVGDLHLRGHLWVLLGIVILILNFRVIIKTLKFIIF